MLELATLFPHAQVIGLDLTDPTENITTAQGPLPPNVQFTVGNVLEGLPFPDSAFDFIHQRLLTGAMPADRWPDVAREVIRVTCPGGWVEFVEVETVQNGGPAMELWVAWVKALSASRGIDLAYAPHIARLMREAGLLHVQARRVDMPIKNSGDRIATMMGTDARGIMSGGRGPITSRGFTDEATYDRTVAQAIVEWDRYQCVQPFYIMYGQRAR